MNEEYLQRLRDSIERREKKARQNRMRVFLNNAGFQEIRADFLDCVSYYWVPYTNTIWSLNRLDLDAIPVKIGGELEESLRLMNKLPPRNQNEHASSNCAPRHGTRPGGQ
jgi:hypothetical protein